MNIQELDTPENLFLSDGIFTEMCSKASITLTDIKVCFRSRRWGFSGEDLADEHSQAAAALRF